MRVVAKLDLRTALGGISGSVDADPRSPRQVLIGSGVDRQQMVGDTNRLRWNVELDTHNLSAGDIIQFDAGPRVWISMECDLCKSLAGIANWPELGTRRGLFGVVLADGEVSPGQTARVVGHYRGLSSDRVERIAQSLHFLADSEEATPIRLVDLLRDAGVQAGYARAFPTYLPKLLHLAPDTVRRVVRGDGRPFFNDFEGDSRFVSSQLVRTWAELVECDNESVGCTAGSRQNAGRRSDLSMTLASPTQANSDRSESIEQRGSG